MEKLHLFKYKFNRSREILNLLVKKKIKCNLHIVTTKEEKKCQKYYIL